MFEQSNENELFQKKKIYRMTTSPTFHSQYKTNIRTVQLSPSSQVTSSSRKGSQTAINFNKFKKRVNHYEPPYLSSKSCSRSNHKQQDRFFKKTNQNDNFGVFYDVSWQTYKKKIAKSIEFGCKWNMKAKQSQKIYPIYNINYSLLDKKQQLFDMGKQLPRDKQNIYNKRKLINPSSTSSLIKTSLPIKLFQPLTTKQLDRKFFLSIKRYQLNDEKFKNVKEII